MSNTVADMGQFLAGDAAASNIANLWHTYDTQRAPIKAEWLEQRNYVFATDTGTTTQAANGWKNSTTMPKLAQIRDNLHSNYISALFPNDDWMKWEAFTPDAAKKKMAVAIESYMQNKVRLSPFRETVSRLIYDYIDYGNAFSTVKYVHRSTMHGSAETVNYIGPVLQRISPLDIVFNPVAESFDDTHKIVRSIKSYGDIMAMGEYEPENVQLATALASMRSQRELAKTFSQEDWNKAQAFAMDGFGSWSEYFRSGYVELLTFTGDYYDTDTGVLHKNQRLVIADRMHVLVNETNPNWQGAEPIYHVGWRERPDNLWSMGPLANLVGMQYRMDHLENSKADAYDVAIHTPLAIIGEVEDFDWGPGCELHLDEGGSVTELSRNVEWVIQGDTGIDRLEARMEFYAGAPREAMGIRSPGEKTAFEVAELQNAAGRIFQEKIEAFEIKIIEKSLNAMLETARRNLDTSDVVRVVDDDVGAVDFMTITKADIQASGLLRPIGARHFAAQSLLLQNLAQLFNGTLGQMVAPHASGIQLSKLVEDTMGLERRAIFSPNAAVFEQQETQRLANQAAEDLDAEAAVTEDDIVQ